MKVAIVSSRNLQIENLDEYLPGDFAITEVVSGGARGIDSSARRYALSNHLKLTEFLPCYAFYGKAAPIRRNEKIVDYADHIFVFWDGVSRGTRYVIDYCKRKGKPITIYHLE